MKTGKLKKFIFVALFTAVFFIACEEEKKSGGDGFAIVSVSASGITDINVPPTKLVIVVSDDRYVLNADDIKINAAFTVFKGEMKLTGAVTYELYITPGKTDKIKVGLDPYRGFTEWNARTVNVYANWYFTGTENLTITGYNQSVIDNPSAIPKKIAGKPVTAIGSAAFYDIELGTVTIPESVISIGISAFENNQLENIIIPEGVTAIYYNAFRKNKLKKIKIPESVSYLSGFNDNELEEVEFSLDAQVAYIGSSAFANNKLSSIDIPESVTNIGSSAFENNLLSSIDIPVKVTNIGSGAFCDNLLSSIVIPEKVTTIDSYAFSNNPLTSITIIGKNVKLGSSAFGGGFEEAYNIEYKKAAGTYTRPNTASKTWTKEEGGGEEEEEEEGEE